MSILKDIQDATLKVSTPKPGDKVVADLDEETNLVTIYVNGSPRMTMHVDVFVELREKLGIPS